MKRYLFPLFFAAVLLLSVFVRISKISTNPPSLFSDEVDAAYQAFVFNKCQTDYYGRKFPIHFRSGSDYRTPGMIWAIALSQKIWGVNNFSARFPSFFFGVLIPLLFYLIGKQILDKRLGLMMMVVASINPWLMHYSRSAFEVSGMLFFILLSIYLWLKYIANKKIGPLLVSLVCLVVSVYFYSTAKLFAVFIFISYLLLSVKEIKKIRLSRLFLIVFFLVAISLPMVWSTLRGEAGYRFSYINIFSEPTLASQVDYYRHLDIKTDNEEIGVKTPLTSKIFHNKYLSVFDTFTKNYFSALSTEFLFNKGDSNIRHGFRQFGYFYPIELVLFIIGLTYFLKQKKYSKVNTFFILFLLFSPIPYSLTRDSLGPHATRLIVMTIPFVYFIGQGIYYLIQKINKPTKAVLLVIYAFFFLNFIHFYYYNYPHLSANAWHAGIDKTILKSDEYEDEYEAIYFSDKYEPNLIFYLYYKQLVPEGNCNIYKNIPFEDLGYFSGRVWEDKIYFGNLEWSKVADGFPENQNNLYIVPESEIKTVSSEIEPMVVKTIFVSKNQYETENKFVFFTIQKDERVRI